MAIFPTSIPTSPETLALLQNLLADLPSHDAASTVSNEILFFYHSLYISLRNKSPEFSFTEREYTGIIFARLLIESRDTTKNVRELATQSNVYHKNFLDFTCDSTWKQNSRSSIIVRPLITIANGKYILRIHFVGVVIRFGAISLLSIAPNQADLSG